MSWSERLVRDHRRRTDAAIHLAYEELASDPTALEPFHALLHCVRKRAASLLAAPFLHGRHSGVEALIHLSRLGHAHLRPVHRWAGSAASWRPALSSLAHHLVCEYRVPPFLASCWYAADAAAHDKRAWFLAHSRGASFRSLPLPVVMTRKMEHIFLASSDHLSIEHALRRAELIALGASPTLVGAILSTRLASNLRHGAFWRTVWIFLIENAEAIDPTQVGPILDYLEAVRHETTTITTPEATRTLDPPQPAFAIKGRTAQSLLRLVDAWHRSLGLGRGAAYTWAPSPLEPLHVLEPRRDHGKPPQRWLLSELTNAEQLRSEGAALHHCVASYADRCRRVASSIWSLRLWQGERVQHVLTHRG